MRNETKTRSVPVTKYRSETKQVKQADGSVKSETVKVPYTEHLTQNYTVQVPYTEQVAQSYQVPVPYTADGKRIERSDYGRFNLNNDGRRSDGERQSSIAGLKNEAGELERTLEFEKASRSQQLSNLSSLKLDSSNSTRIGGLRDGDTGIATRSSSSPSSGKNDAPAEADKAKAIVLVADGAMGNLTITGHPGAEANAEKGIERLTIKAKSAQQPMRGKNPLGDQFAPQGQATGSQVLNGPTEPPPSEGDSGEKSEDGSEQFSEDSKGSEESDAAEKGEQGSGDSGESSDGSESSDGGEQSEGGEPNDSGEPNDPSQENSQAEQGESGQPENSQSGQPELGSEGESDPDSQGNPSKSQETDGVLDGTSNTMSIPETKRLAGRTNKGKPAEYLFGGEIPIEGRTNPDGKTTLGTPTITMYNGQSKSGPQSHFYKSEFTPHNSDASDSEEVGFDIGSNGHSPNGWFEGVGGRGGFGNNYDKNTGGEQYEPIFENAFIAAKGPAAISTFSIDVDTASYANMRRMLNSGRRPPPNSIRLEELVNYFQYDYAQPTGDHPFSVNLELADCPWEPGQQLLRVGLKGKDIHVAERPPTNVVFLIDVSGSMSSNDKLPLLKSGFQMMSRQLGENDRVSIVTYAGNAGVALEPTNGTQTSTINTAIERLSSGGSTHGSAGIQLAYELAQKNFIQGGVNRVMLATDGDLNVGVTSDDALVKLIKEKAAEGVFLTVLGFGTGNLKDGKLEKLADNGNGVYSYIDSTREARRVLVDQLSGSLVTIAKDVKIQVEFNPAEVKSYRLLGYENRMLETKDFDDDAKDAGEIGAGHTVTAIYQIEPAKAVSPAVSLPAGMKYQVNSPAKPETELTSVEGEDADGLSKAALSGELATVALRYKQPAANESERLEVSIKNNPERFNEASADFRFAASVAGFGMYLRNSEHRGSIDAGMLQRIASESIGKDESGYRSEFIDLIRKASNR